MNTAVIIVTYNSAATLAACLASVLAARQAGDELIVIDNASRDATPTILTALAASLPSDQFTVILNSTNKGFSVATNQGIKASHAPLVALLNPDTVVSSGWLQRLTVHLQPDHVAAVGPISNFAAGRQSVACHWKGALPEQVGVQEAAEYLYVSNKGLSESVPLLIGFCMLVRRNVLDRLGGLDERLFLGNDDLELSWRLRLYGYELKIACDCFVYHEGQHSFSSDPETVTGRLVAESSDALYKILQDSYGVGRVPSPTELWGIDWFNPPSYPGFNQRVHFHQVVSRPIACELPDSNFPLTSIIILTWNQLSYTKECLAALEQNTPEPFEAIVVDNGSQDGTVAFLRVLAAGDSRYQLIENSSNRGYAAGCNQGLAAASGTYLVLLNNDVLVTPGWLSGLISCHQTLAKTGVVGPLTNNASGIQGLGTQDYGSVGLDEFAQQFKQQHRHRRIPSRRLVGFCMLFHRQLFHEIAGLDERFGTGNYEDDDFCLRAAIAGYRNMIAGDVYVHHYGSVTFRGEGVDYCGTLSGNWSLFRDKWSAPLKDREEAEKVSICRLREEGEWLLQAEQYAVVMQQLEGQSALLQAEPLLKEQYATALWAGGRYAAAVELLSSDCALTLTLKGLLALEAGNTTEAEQFLWSSVCSDPGFSGSYPALAQLAYNRGEQEYAAALAFKGLVLDPTVPGFVATVEQYLLGDVSVSLLHMLQDASRLWTENRQVWRLLLSAAVQAGQYDVAVAAAEQCLLRFGLDLDLMEAGLTARQQVGLYRAASDKGHTVSLCMIVKNEEQNLPRCLVSCRPLVHELIVVDTGSTDRTPQVAELFGARLYHRAWDGDFSAARNCAVEVAQGDWIMIMDADERVSVRDYAQFRSVLADSVPCGYSMVTRNYVSHASLEGFRYNNGKYPEDEAGVGWTESSKVRLFPNHRSIRFNGVVHETVDADVVRAGLAILHHPVPVQHYGGLDPQRQQYKQRFYYELGKKKLQQQRDAQAVYELAVQAGELSAFNEAELLWRELLVQEPNRSVAWFNLGYVLLQQGRIAESLDATQRALELKPNYPAALSNAGICLFCLQLPHEALDSMMHLHAQAPDELTLRILLALLQYLIHEESVTEIELLGIPSEQITVFLQKLGELLHKTGRGHDADLLQALVSYFE